jgi:hypothetical protein
MLAEWATTKWAVCGMLLYGWPEAITVKCLDLTIR